jgi:murein DD-endopeptidase MepM/ murein hydrolase activator NlpD
MKGFLRLFLIITIIGLSLFAIQRFLFPFVYKIKEPYFAMPIRAGGLLIRNDSYGDGAFGAKRENKRLHKGLDLAAKIKSPVYASKSGWAKAYYIPEGYGNLVVINHPGGYQTRYGHLNESAVKRLQWVGQGDRIGSVGKTGNADRRGMVPHLHFEIKHGGKPLDPAPLLKLWK